MQALLTVALAFVASSVGTRLFIDWLAARRLVASENDRTMHTGAVPQGGGTPVTAAALAAALVLWPVPLDCALLTAVAAGLSVMSALNDRRDIAFTTRLAVHAAAATLALALLPATALVFGGALPFALDRLVALVGLVWFVNLYNFMDGIDGITGVETITIAGGALLVTSVSGGATAYMGLGLALVGAAAGFLVWNWHRARIFLGDAGSIPLGFLCGVLLLDLALTTSLAAAIILPLYYLTDATSTLARRFFAGEKVWQAHRKHAYQRAARAAGSHSAIVIRVMACNGVLVSSAILALAMPLVALAAAAAAVAFLMRDLEAIARHGPPD